MSVFYFNDRDDLKILSVFQSLKPPYDKIVRRFLYCIGNYERCRPLSAENRLTGGLKNWLEPIPTSLHESKVKVLCVINTTLYMTSYI
ncbi:MAG: hypothetical protein K0Q73_176 [Paenibacillus sp.]|jgi:hypothetical protein|nr:hypothetical protein [Paenibacillus sp.]